MTVALRLCVRVATAVAATATTAAIIVGIPTALWLLTRALLRDGIPAGTTVVDLLMRPDDGTLLMGFLALVAAAAWLVLTVSIVTEFAAALIGRPAPRIDLPGFRLGRSVAAALVAAVVGAGPALATTGVSTPIALSSTADDTAAQADLGRAARTSGPAADDGPHRGLSHVVQHRDTLWRIAETTLGDPIRWREIYDLNVGRDQADGGKLTESSHLSIGWVLQLPADARDTIRVAPGDTLHGLAAEHLGDADRADELLAANIDTPQPGGAPLADPDLILPGWTLTVPGSQGGPSLDAPTTRPAPEASSGETPLTSTPPEVDTDRPTPSSQPTESPENGVPAPVVTTPSPTPQPENADAAPPPGPGAAQAADEPDQADAEQPDWLVSVVGLTGVVTTGVVAALALRRRRQQRHRPFRHKIAVPSDQDGRWEASLARSNGADVTDASAARQLDLALRSLAHPERRLGDGPPPVVRSARLTDAHALITTGGAATLPAPFTPTDETGVWGLDADTPLPVPRSEAAGCCAPFPTLVSIATDTGAGQPGDTSADRTLLIDLEQRGVLRVGGDAQRSVALLRHIAAELATSPTAEDTEVLLVGLGEELEALNPERLRGVEDLDTALSMVESRAAATRTALESWSFGSVVEGRLRDVAADSWLPTVLLVAQPPGRDDRDRLGNIAAAAPGVTGVAIVVIDDQEPELTIGPGGRLDVPDVHDGPWQAVQLTERAGTHLAELLGTTAAPPVPVEPSGSAETWAGHMNEDGSLADGSFGKALNEALDGPATQDRRDEHNQDPFVVPEPRTESDGLALFSDPAGGRASHVLAVARHQDPHLDDDLVAWNDPAAPQMPMIAILGEPTVRAPGPIPGNRPSWFAEVLVYLSLHPVGVTSSKAVTDLWPEGQRISPATVRHAFYGARKWAGRGLSGDLDAAFVSDMQHDRTYRLRGHLLDWDLFRRLRKRGQARHAALDPGAVADYRAALDLLRGPVLSALRPGGYAWLNNHDQRHDLQIPGFVVDTAHELVDIALTTGDTATARWAADQARAVDIDVAFDQPLTDLMRIAHAEDNRAELELHAAVLLDARGFDVPEELAPDSFAVLNELLPAGPRRAKS